MRFKSALLNSIVYRGEGGGKSSPSYGIQERSWGLFVTKDKQVAERYGKVQKFDASNLKIYDFKDPILNEELSDLLHFQVDEAWGLSEGLDEWAYNKSKYPELESWLKSKGFNAIRGNFSESEIFVLDAKALKLID